MTEKENELPIEIKVNRDDNTERVKVSGKLELNYVIELPIETVENEDIIKFAVQQIKFKVTNTFIKLAIQEIKRQIQSNKINLNYYFPPNCYFTYDIDEGTTLILIHPKKFFELQKEKRY